MRIYPTHILLRPLSLLRKLSSKAAIASPKRPTAELLSWKPTSNENEQQQFTGAQKLVYDFIRYFSDVRDHAIGSHELAAREDAVRGREMAYLKAREMLKVARNKQEDFIKYQKDIANLHSKLITSDEAFKEHLYERIRRAEAERPFPASYDPLSKDMAAKDSVYVCEQVLDDEAKRLFEAREILYQRKLESTQKREDVNKIIAIISVLLSLAVVEPIRRYFLIRYNSSANMKCGADISVQTELSTEPIALSSEPKIAVDEPLTGMIPSGGVAVHAGVESEWWEWAPPFVRGLGLGVGAGLGFGICFVIINVIKN